MAYVAVASAIALQLSGTIHLAVVQHAICSEHGEAMDVAEDAHEHAAPLQVSDSAEAQISAGRHPTPPDDDSHHHCPLDEDRNTHALVVYAAAISALLATTADLTPARAEPVHPNTRELHLLAPKTSPPA